MATSSPKHKGFNFIIWLIGIAILITGFHVVLPVITIWGFLGVIFLWSVFWVRES